MAIEDNLPPEGLTHADMHFIGRELGGYAKLNQENLLLVKERYRIRCQPEEIEQAGLLRHDDERMRELNDAGYNS